MRNEKVEYCKETGKYCYSSEAKATRALNRYEDIERVYFCSGCEQYHTTSIGRGLAIKQGILKQKAPKKCNERVIAKRLEKLQERLDKLSEI